MKLTQFNNVRLSSGYLFDKQELNRKKTLRAVYDRFEETGRIGAFRFDYNEETTPKEKRPHFFWDSDVAKWIEAAAYQLKLSPDRELEEKIDAVVENVKKNQGEDGYFNIYFTVIDPKARFTDRNNHELYCAGHLMEAAVAYADATGKRELLSCMEKYADYIERVFIKEKSAAFFTPGHEEIEIALVKMYLFTGKKKYLDMALYFVDTRGTVEEQYKTEYSQSHMPVREQREALGHSVRAMYLYTSMAMLAKETGDAALTAACKSLWEDTVLRKMYVTGGLGSTPIGEAFTVPFDLPNDQAYTETCAGVGLIFFSGAMLALENDAKYADAIERVLYNGVLSGLSLDGEAFFYENPLEINLRERFQNSFGRRRFPITQRLKCFGCSCCPPNLNRLIASIGGYIYGIDGDTLFVNQFTSSTLDEGGVRCTQATDYPVSGTVKLRAEGVKRIAVRIPEWADSFKLNKPYELSRGYAYISDCDGEITLELDMKPRAVFADARIKCDAGRVAVMRGPIVYCAEGVDNGEFLHSYVLPESITATESLDGSLGLCTLEVECQRREGYDGGLYSNRPPRLTPAKLKLIPYNCFANRGESDMLVWFLGSF